MVKVASLCRIVSFPHVWYTYHTVIQSPSNGKKTFFYALRERVPFETNLEMNCFTFEDWIVPWGGKKEEEHHTWARRESGL